MTKKFTETYSSAALRPLREGEDRVDRVSGTLTGIKLLGYESKNDEGRRRYVKPEAALYEGRPINLNHPEMFSDVRVQDRWGVVIPGTVQVLEDGVYGNVEYDPNHPSTESLLWWAEKHPNQLGMSHMAYGTQEEIDGMIWVTVTEVESVDLVARPATTAGFFESAKENEPMEYKERYEAEVAAHAATKAELESAKQAQAVAEQALETERAEREKTERTARRTAMLEAADLGKVKQAFKDAVLTAETDEAATALIESVKDLAETTAKPKSGSKSEGDSESPKTYEEIKKAGKLSYR